jgi:xylan 1,4-beta-xylosidase
MEVNDWVQGYSFWTFSDIFEENYFPSMPFHGGFGLLTVHGIAKPAYRAFQLLRHLGTEVLTVEGWHETVDAWVVRNRSGVTVLLTNHALPRHPVESQRVHVRLIGAPPPRAVRIERIDGEHANAKGEWRRMGEPEYLARVDVERLDKASRVIARPWPWSYTDGTIELEIDLPPHGVAAITVELGKSYEAGGSVDAHGTTIFSP